MLLFLRSHFMFPNNVYKIFFRAQVYAENLKHFDRENISPSFYMSRKTYRKNKQDWNTSHRKYYSTSNRNENITLNPNLNKRKEETFAMGVWWLSLYLYTNTYEEVFTWRNYLAPNCRRSWECFSPALREDYVEFHQSSQIRVKRTNPRWRKHIMSYLYAVSGHPH